MTDRKIERAKAKKKLKEMKKAGTMPKHVTFAAFYQSEKITGPMLKRFNELKKLENERVAADLGADANKAVEDMFFAEADAFDDLEPIEITFDEK